MQITRQADYAIRAVMYLSRLGSNQRAAPSQAAKEQSIRAITRQDVNIRQLNEIRRSGDAYKDAMLSYVNNSQAMDETTKVRNTVAEEVLKYAQET